MKFETEICYICPFLEFTKIGISFSKMKSCKGYKFINFLKGDEYGKCYYSFGRYCQNEKLIKENENE